MCDKFMPWLENKKKKSNNNGRELIASGGSDSDNGSSDELVGVLLMAHLNRKTIVFTLK